MEIDWTVIHGAVGGSWKNEGKEEKPGVFFQFLGFIGIYWKKEEGIPSWDLAAGENS